MADPSNIFKKDKNKIEESILSVTSHLVSHADASIWHPQGCTSRAIQASPFGNAVSGLKENSVSER